MTLELIYLISSSIATAIAFIAGVALGYWIGLRRSQALATRDQTASRLMRAAAQRWR